MEDKETEYATQFFDFVPESFADELNEECNDLISEALEKIKLKILSKFTDKVNPAEMEEAIGTVEDKYRMEVDKAFEKLSSNLSETVFKVPRHVLLAEDEVWEDRQSSEVMTALADTTSAVVTIRSKIKTALYKKKILEDSLEMMQSTIQKQEDNIKAYNQLLHRYNVSDWKELTELTVENRKALFEKMRSLENPDDSLSKSDSLLSSRQRDINSKNCARILNEIQRKIEDSEPVTNTEVM